MPDLTGLTLAQARKALANAGLGAPNYDSGAARMKGHRVVKQSPSPGTPVAPGISVDLGFDTPDKPARDVSDGPA
jgi:beta-lactam-binding protein with PASTA domain